MSAPKFRLELTEPAKLDFRDILSFTLRNWGEGQLAEYKRKINDALTAISENPHIGCKKHGMMVFHAGRHMIFYRIAGTTLYIIRILHERMDALRYLRE